MAACPICSSTHVQHSGGIWNSTCGQCGWVWDDPALLPAIEIPDSIGEVTGVRAWNIVETYEGPRITSQGYGGDGAHGIWNPGEVLTAHCNKRLGHRSPDEGCTCGFYAAKDREHLIEIGRYHVHRDDKNASDKRVIGTVMMDGKVVPATLGFRGENIWPVEIRVPFIWPELAIGLNLAYSPYGVKVGVDNTQDKRPWGSEKVARPDYCHCGRKLVDRKCPRHGKQ